MMPEIKRINIGYIASIYPLPTFTTSEVLAVSQKGINVSVFPVKRSKQKTSQLSLPVLPDITAWYDHILTAAFYNLVAPLMHPVKYWHCFQYAVTSTGTNLFSIKKGTTSGIRNLLLMPVGIYYSFICQQKKVGHIHAEFAGVPATIAIMISKYTGIGYSFSGHGFDLHFMPPHDLVARVKNAVFFRTISEYNKKFLLGKYAALNDTDIKVIRCGVDLAKFKYVPKRQHSDKLRLLSVGRLAPVKGYQYLLDACILLDKTGQDFILNIIGDGQLFDELKVFIAAHNLDNKVFLRGYCPQEEISKYCNESDIFVLASLSEGIPVVIMEAMATGMPVVATKITGVPEIVEDGSTGYLVEPKNPEALANAIIKLMKEPQRAAEFGKNGRRKVERMYDITENGRAMAELFVTRLSK